MENHVSQQLSAYLTAAALGAASAMCYDLLRTVRLRRRRNRRLTGALDAVYIAVQGLLLLWFALRIGQGELRLYMLTGMALGALLYGLTLPPLLRQGVPAQPGSGSQNQRASQQFQHGSVSSR